jgi:hypothetical protein
MAIYSLISKWKKNQAKNMQQKNLKKGKIVPNRSRVIATFSHKQSHLSRPIVISTDVET